MDKAQLEELAKAIAKFVPNPPREVTPIEYVAVMLAVLLGLSAMMFLFFFLPRLVDKIIQAIHGVGVQVDKGRGEMEAAARERASGLHDKLDGLDDKIAKLRVTVAERLPPRRCRPGDPEDSGFVTGG